MRRKALFVFVGVLLGASLCWAQAAPLHGEAVQRNPDGWFLLKPSPARAALAADTPAYATWMPSAPWQISATYTLLRFYELPKQVNNFNGVSASLTRFFGENYGIEGEMVPAWGNSFGQSSKYIFVGGGFHARYVTTNRYEPWLHILAGVAHETPQTVFGDESAVGFEVGGGIDWKLKSHTWVRAGAGGIGTRFFNTTQFSPKFDVGFVLNF